MSSVSANSSFQAYRKQWRLEKSPRLTEQFCDVSHFLCRLRVQMRYGELTRAPLKLLRLQISADTIECDWLARPPDAWDADLPRKVGRRHASLQALRDAIDVRALLFHTLPDAETAYFHIYRESSSKMPEMIMTGCTQRNDNSARGVHSLAMRAKVLGFRFCLEDDILCKLPGGDKPLSVAHFEPA
jgi:hypothetical protein